MRYYRPHEPHILATAWLTLDLTLFPNSLLAKICWEGTQMYFKRRGGQNPYDRSKSLRLIKIPTEIFQPKLHQSVMLGLSDTLSYAVFVYLCICVFVFVYLRV